MSVPGLPLESDTVASSQIPCPCRAWARLDKVDLFPYSNLELLKGIPTMGFQAPCFVHQLVCMDSMQLPLRSVMVLAVEGFPVTAACRPDSRQIHWASGAVGPEVELSLIHI